MEGLDLLKIGEAIKIRRIKRRIHQTKLAEQLGISQTHLSNAENGRVMLSLKALLKLKMPGSFLASSSSAAVCSAAARMG